MTQQHLLTQLSGSLRPRKRTAFPVHGGSSPAVMIAATLLLAALFTGCSTDSEDFILPTEMPLGGMMGGNVTDDTDAPGFETSISGYGGELATDASADTAGDDADFFHEANSFQTVVNVQFNNGEAKVNCASNEVIAHIAGAHVKIDLLTNSVKNVNIRLSGKTEDGSLKVYGEKKFMLTLDNVDITSKRGAAINSQCKKRMFLNIADGTVNSLADNASYADDCYYPEGVTADDEDRKGCLFSEGNIIVSGHGLLKVAGKHKHGIATDGYFWMRPGVTIAVTEAAKNALHVKGDETDGIGVTINGGLLYANVSSDAGKGIKTDMMVEINGGRLLLNTSGKSIYDNEEKDTSSPSCIRADGNITIAGGELILKSTGTGGKGISTEATLNMTGGTATITTTGGKYTYSQSLTSSPKGVKAQGDINIRAGKLNISVTGKSDGSEGLESKQNLTIDGGDIYVYAYDDAINAAKDLTINSGAVFAHALNNDGIDSNGSLTINGGTVIASGANSPEESFDIETRDKFLINGGTVIGIAGSCSTPGTGSSQYSLLYGGGLTAAKGAQLTITNASGEQVLSYKLHRTLTGLTLFASAPKLTNGSYTISADGTQLATFTASSVVTTVGTTGGMGGGNPGMGGGGPGSLSPFTPSP